MRNFGNGNLIVSPNPFASEVTFRWDQNSLNGLLSVYDLRGGLVFNKAISSSELLNCTQIRAGLLLL